jgi:plasmid stabilization system protein ParE
LAQLHWHVEAITDLDAIAEYIAGGSPRFAPLFVARIVQSVERLGPFPESGRVVPELGDDTYREVIFQNYRIVYRPLGSRVIIIGVIHGAMDFGEQASKRGWKLT